MTNIVFPKLLKSPYFYGIALMEMILVIITGASKSTN